MTPGRNRKTAAMLLLLLVLLVVMTPLLSRHHWSLTALALTRFFSLVCHQDPDRSFTILDATLPVCVRCFGIYCGAAVGVWLGVSRTHARRLLIAALLMNMLEVAGEMLGFSVGIPVIRLALGLTLGFGTAALVVSSYPPRRLLLGTVSSE